MLNFKKLISAILCFILLFSVAVPAFAVDINTPGTAAKLTLNKKQTVNISKGGGKVYFYFTPDKTGVYEFISVSKDCDPCGSLYNSDMEQLVFNDGVIEELDFSVVYRLKKGEKYYFSASLFENTAKGSFEVMLRYYDGIFIESYTGDVDVLPGEKAVFEVKAYSNAGGLVYQWETEYRAKGKNGYYYWATKELQNATSNTYTFNSAKLSANIKCVITDISGNLETLWFGLFVNSKLNASGEGDEFRVVSPGGSETLSVNATAEYGSVHYQWYKEYKISNLGGEDAWKGEILSGETKNSLNLKNLTSPANYNCLVYDDYGNFEEFWFYVSINSGLTASAIGSAERSVKAGSNETLSVDAKVNKGKIHYQWYKKYRVHDDTGYSYETEKISGGTSASLNLKNLSWTADYVCSVSDDYGNNEYVWFYITVDSGFNIITPYITNITVGTGIKATLSVKASGEGLTYRWGSFFFDGDSEFGNTEKSEFTTPALYDYTEFYCFVMDANGNGQRVWFYISIDNSIEHSFNKPVWDWSSNYGSAAAKFVCKSESVHIETAKAKITKTAVDPTCTKSGKTDYTATAEFYGKTYTDTKTVTLPALGHSWDKGAVTTEPTTKKEGVLTYTCTVCGSKKTDSIPKLPEAETTQPSNPQKPSTDNIILGDIDKDKKITTKDARLALRAAVGLDKLNSELTKIADVDGSGTITTSDARLILRAAVGLEKLATDINSAHSHKWDNGKITKAATCTAEGAKTYTCSVCGTTKTESIKKTGHKWDGGKVTKAATCTAAGTKTYTCSVCKTTKTEAIEKTGHKWDNGKVTKAATLTQTGTKTYTCINCKNTKTETIPATGGYGNDPDALDGYNKLVKYIVEKGKAVSTGDYSYTANSKLTLVYEVSVKTIRLDCANEYGTCSIWLPKNIGMAVVRGTTVPQALVYADFYGEFPINAYDGEIYNGEYEYHFPSSLGKDGRDAAAELAYTEICTCVAAGVSSFADFIKSIGYKLSDLGIKAI